MATSTQLRAKIAELMLTVADIGRVHEYERYAKDNSGLKALYLYKTHLRGWFVRRVRVRRNSIVGKTTVRTTWQIRGYLSLNDEGQTEKTMDDLVDALLALFSGDADLGGLVSDLVTSNSEDGLQLDDSGPVMFAGVLSHGVRLTLNTRHEE